MTKGKLFVKTLGLVALIFSSMIGVNAQTLIAHYPFNNTLAASTGAFGAAVIGTAGTATLGASSVCTDNSNNNGLRTPHISTLSTTNFQIDFTVNLTSMPTVANGPLFVINGGTRYFGLLLNQSGQLKILYNNASESGIASGITLTTGTNYNIQVQYINGVTNLIVNNVVYLSTTLPTLDFVTFDRTIYLGDNPGAPGAFIEGCYSNLKVYNNPSLLAVYANSASGNDGTGNGTQASPYATFHKAYQMIGAGGIINLSGTFDWTNTDETGDVITSGYTIAKNITISGVSSDQTIIQADPTANTTNRRVFTINSGVTATIQKVTIRNGKVANLDNSVYPADGGAIYNSGSLSLNNCRFTANYALAGGSFSGGAGGAIKHMANNTLTINSCTFDNNQAKSGGALANEFANGSGIFIITNSTFANNKQLATTGTNGGGAIWILHGTNVITNCTFNANELTTGSGAGSSILVRQGSVQIKNTIFVNGLVDGSSLGTWASEIDFAGGNATDEGNNIFGKQYAALNTPQTTSFYDSYTSTNAADGIFTKYNSSPAQNCNLTISSTLTVTANTNGTYTLVTSGVSQNNGSTVANNGVSIPTVDQRGVARVNQTDIGSYESNATAPLISSTSSLSSFTTNIGTPSSEQSFSVSGTNLSGNITITAPTGYQVSTTSGSNFATSLNLTPVSNTVSSTTIYIRLSGASSGAVNGNVSLASLCTGSQSISLSGTVTDNYTWTGTTSTDWATASNWSPAIVPSSASVTIPASGISNFPVVSNLTIDAGKTLTLLSNAKLNITGVLTNNGTMTIESGATLVQGSSSTVAAGSGTYNVKQSITGANNGSAPNGRFWYLGSPVATSSSSVLFANTANVVKKRDEATNAWIALASGTPENLSVGRGYYTQAMSNSTITFTGGAVNNGDITISGLSRTASQGFEGFNLVSNPYPSYLNWDNVVKTEVSNTMWYRTFNSTNNTMVFDTYVAGTNGIGTNLNGAGVSNLIPPMQSFWVRVNPNANPSLNNTGSLGLTNAMRAHFTSINGSVAGLKSTSNERDLFLRMNLLQADKKDQLIVYVNETATNGFDILDGEKMMQAGFPQFYTKAGDKKIVINGLNSAKKQQSLPITMELPTTGVHSFVIEDLEISNGLVWLEDKQEEIIQALEPGTVYEFYANSGMNAERFVLHFQLIDDAVPTNVYNEVNSSANFSGKGANVHAEAAGVVVIKLPASTEGVTDIQIRDAAGRVVYTGSTNTLETSVQLAQANGIYYVTLNSNSGVEVRKVFIQQ
jgi:hypothetical protein